MLGYGGGLRGGKHTVYEGGVRAPLIVRWPRRIEANVVNETSIISATDWLPTLGSIVGIDLDAVADELDGEDVSDIWFGARRSRKKPIFWRTSVVGAPVTMRSGKWKITELETGYELYDIAVDPLEMTDLGASRLDVVERLAPEIRDWEAGLPGSYVDERLMSRRRPKADAGPDQSVNDLDGDGRALVKLDATGSRDRDGFIAGFVWKLGKEKIAVGRSPLVELPLGEHSITLVVSDYSNKRGRDRVRIRVIPYPGGELPSQRCPPPASN